MPRACLILIIFFFPLLIFAEPAVLLTNVRIEPAATQTRLVFELTQEAKANVKFLSRPNRLLIEFADAKKDFILNHAHFKDEIITAIEDDQKDPDKVRIILHLAHPVKWDVEYTKNKRINTINFQLDLVAIKPTKRTMLEKNIVKVFSVITAAANRNVIRQDQLARARLNGKLKEEKTKTKLADEPQKTFTIVIDAGHGGNDTGAIGTYGIAEKMVVLNIAKLLAAKINAMPNMKAILTRDGDYFVPLRTRLKLARKGDADLFIAIHADAYFQKNATGASVYALSKRGATSEASRWLAQKENYSELDDVAFGSLKDRSEMLRSVLIDLAQTTTIRDSLNFGSQILNALDDVTSLKSKRVEQAPFVVLKSPDIPSILIETGFITNPNEEKRLASSFYQNKLASALANGIKNFVDKNLRVTK